MIQSILDFRDTVVRDVMIPRTSMLTISADASVEEIIAAVIKHGHTRMPVYKTSIDNIIGILNVKDLLKLWSLPVTEADIIAIIRKPYFIPETKNTRLLLHELKQRKYHMAIVIDEYGGTAGLVTMEDLIEEIVGEIHDEYDKSPAEMIETRDGYYLIDGRVEIEKIEEIFNFDFPEGKFKTLSGLILHEAKRIPIKGEVILIGNLKATIEAADERSIKKVRLEKREVSEEVSGVA
ncbi:MAG: hemolysin family protein [Smithellaceae bacterium]|nr:hemolysin family protein [Smithellaceae bacterium]